MWRGCRPWVPHRPQGSARPGRLLGLLSGVCWLSDAHELGHTALPSLHLVLTLVLGPALDPLLSFPGAHPPQADDPRHGLPRL